MRTDGLSAGARRLTRRLAELSKVSDEKGRLTRTFLSPAMRRAGRMVGGWMRAEGLSVRVDAVGNLIGRLRCGKASAKTLLLGSHLDTVRDAGRFDGALGVLLPVAALGELLRRGVALPYDVEVIGFSEEEGVRFTSAYLGSKGYAGLLRAADLGRRDAAGVTVREALAAFGGGRFHPPPPAHAQGDLMGYVEAHIEQGPVLESLGLALGTVSAIAGQTRGRITFHGKAGHAGTTPMALRRDALAGAAECVLFAEALARRHPPLVATVGHLSAEPGAPNVIPGKAALSFDIRHPLDSARRGAVRTLIARARAVARRRRLGLEVEIVQDGRAVACSRRLSALLGASVGAVQKRRAVLVSGAGHDAVVMSGLAPVAMLFVRCRGGLSHHPDEFASEGDLRAALGALVDFMERLASER